MLDEYMQDNTKYNNLLLLKRGDIGWVFTDDELKLDNENDEKALNVALNKISGRWDNEKLSILFNDLNDVDFDTSLTGFEDFEIDLYIEGDLETLNIDDYNDEYDLPEDYVDVQGDKANKSYVVSIGFDNQEIANKFLEYIDYPRQMNRDTLQFMFTELEWDLDKLLEEKETQNTNTYTEEEVN